MKSLTIHEKRRCDFCDNDALYDVPTLTGQWANVCASCFGSKCDRSYAKQVGTRFVVTPKVAKLNQGVIVNAIEDYQLEDLEAMVMGTQDRQAECPLCGHVRTLEFDARYFNCECGAKVKCQILC